MAKIATPGDIIGKELQKEHRRITEGVNAAGQKAAEKLTKRLRQTAPRKTGKYARSIGYTSRTSPATGSTTYTVGAKGKQGRLTHLLANPHDTRSGGRTKGDPFLANSVREVLPEYEKEVRQVIKGGFIE